MKNKVDLPHFLKKIISLIFFSLTLLIKKSRDIGAEEPLTFT